MITLDKNWVLKGGKVICMIPLQEQYGKPQCLRKNVCHRDRLRCSKETRDTGGREYIYIGEGMWALEHEHCRTVIQLKGKRKSGVELKSCAL